MTFSRILFILFALFAVAGGVDYIISNRLGLGKAFAGGWDPAAIPAMMAAKLTAGVTALALALVVTRRFRGGNPTPRRAHSLPPHPEHRTFSDTSIIHQIHHERTRS